MYYIYWQIVLYNWSQSTIYNVDIRVVKPMLVVIFDYYNYIRNKII